MKNGESIGCFKVFCGQLSLVETWATWFACVVIKSSCNEVKVANCEQSRDIIIQTKSHPQFYSIVVFNIKCFLLFVKHI